MALRNNNYLDKRTNRIVPVIALAHVNTKLGYATFDIGISREDIIKGNIIETIKISNINFERDVNPFEFAYNYAKGQKKEECFNHETFKAEEITVNMPFYGWEDER